MKAVPITFRKLWPRLKFSKYRSKVKAKVTNFENQWKGLVTRNTHVKYESRTYYGSKVMAKVKVFIMEVKGQGEGHKVKLLGITYLVYITYNICNRDMNI